ncbi:MAG: DVU_1553 family AMP-dependent CoA ligase [Syntrophorhabdales bacterium]
MPKTPLEAWISRKIGGVGPMTREAVRTYQLEKLAHTLDYARKMSPFYRRHLEGFDHLTHLHDIGRLPFTSADDLRDDPQRFLCVPQGEITRVVTLGTSGTTGEPKRLFFTQDDLELTIDFFCVGMSTLVKPNQSVLILLPGEKPDSVGDLLARGLKRMDVQGIIHGPVRDTRTTAGEIMRRKIDSLVGIPTQVLALARSEAGSLIEKGMIKSVLLSTDYVPMAIVSELNRLWGCSVFNHYGMTETGLGGGVECEAHAGYHLREADLYFEVVDPVTGNPLEDGLSGEIVFTTLTRKGMPLVRYRTGDMARFIPEPCPCGTILRRMEPVKGRWDGRAPLGREGSLTLPEVDEVLFRLPWLLNYGIRLTADEKKDCLEVTVYADSGHEQKGYEVSRALKDIRAVREGIEGGWVQLAPVRFTKEDWFTTGVGKRRIIDERQIDRSDLPRAERGAICGALLRQSRRDSDWN